jgi:hypothetical protein
MTRRSAPRTVIPIREEFGRYREPTLEEILSDPIVEAVMRADSVDSGELAGMLSKIADERRAAFLAAFRTPDYLGEERSRFRCQPAPHPASRRG